MAPAERAQTQLDALFDDRFTIGIRNATRDDAAAREREINLLGGLAFANDDKATHPAVHTIRRADHSRRQRHDRIATRSQARSMIFDYIETFYNRSRLHSALAYRSQLHFEQLFPSN